MSKTYNAAYWDGVRAEREAQERADAAASRGIALDLERQAILAEAKARLSRAIESADAQKNQYWQEPKPGVNTAFYRGKAEGLEIALAIVNGILTDRSAR